jgi:hypothetical protein
MAVAAATQLIIGGSPVLPLVLLTVMVLVVWARFDFRLSPRSSEWAELSPSHRKGKREIP